MPPWFARAHFPLAPSAHDKVYILDKKQLFETMELQIDLNLTKELGIRISLLPSSGYILFCQISHHSLSPVVGNPAPSCGGQEEASILGEGRDQS